MKREKSGERTILFWNRLNDGRRTSVDGGGMCGSVDDCVTRSEVCGGRDDDDDDGVCGCVEWVDVFV